MVELESEIVPKRYVWREGTMTPTVTETLPIHHPTVTQLIPDRYPPVTRPSPDCQPTVTRPLTNRYPTVTQPTFVLTAEDKCAFAPLFFGGNHGSMFHCTLCVASKKEQRESKRSVALQQVQKNQHWNAHPCRLRFLPPPLSV